MRCKKMKWNDETLIKKKMEKKGENMLYQQKIYDRLLSTSQGFRGKKKEVFPIKKAGTGELRHMTTSWEKISLTFDRKYTYTYLECYKA